MRKLKSISR